MPASLVDLNLKPSTLARYGLPDMAYPIPQWALQEAFGNGGELPLAAMLCGLQIRAEAGDVEWTSLERAMDRLAELLAPADEAQATTVAGDDWWLELGPVDLTHEMTTIQRTGHLLAAIAPRADGRLRVAVYRPLDAGAAGILIRAGRLPGPDGKVSMRDNNWELALDSSVGFGQMYTADAGLAYRSYWRDGLGVDGDGNRVEAWWRQRTLKPRPIARVATELGVHYSYSGDD